jgi:Ala-tRNA(Pro) deacylase
MTDETSTDVFGRIQRLLDAQNVEYRVLDHPPVTTSAEAARVRGASLSSGAKAMLVRSERGLHLAVLPANRRVTWSKLRRALSVKNVALVSDEEVRDLCGLTKGSIPPIGSVLGVETWMDEALLEEPFVNFNAGSLTRSIQMRVEDLVRVAQPRLAAYGSAPVEDP